MLYNKNLISKLNASPWQQMIAGIYCWIDTAEIETSHDSVYLETFNVEHLCTNALAGAHRSPMAMFADIERTFPAITLKPNIPNLKTFAKHV